MMMTVMIKMLMMVKPTDSPAVLPNSSAAPVAGSEGPAHEDSRSHAAV